MTEETAPKAPELLGSGPPALPREVDLDPLEALELRMLDTFAAAKEVEFRAARTLLHTRCREIAAVHGLDLDRPENGIWHFDTAGTVMRRTNG